MSTCNSSWWRSPIRPNRALSCELEAGHEDDHRDGPFSWPYSLEEQLTAARAEAQQLREERDKLDRHHGYLRREMDEIRVLLNVPVGTSTITAVDMTKGVLETAVQTAEAEVARLRSLLTDATAARDEAERCLQQLVDVQNGPPLVKYAGDWHHAMNEAELVLDAARLRAETPEGE